MREYITRHTKRAAIATAGGLVVIIGLILVPYPGPGWLIVFAGLAILATEFEFARKVLETLRNLYDRWKAWVKRQDPFVEMGILILTGIIVVVTVWLVNGFGIINAAFHLDQQWLISPLFR